MLAEISADLDQTTESIVQRPDDGNSALKGWLNNTINKLTQAFTPQVPPVVNDYSLRLSENINSLKIELSGLKKREAQIESSLKATIDSLLKILGPKVSQSQAFREVAQF